MARYPATPRPAGWRGSTGRWAAAPGRRRLVELGANDGLRGLSPEELRRNLTAILDRLAARHIPVLLTGMYAPPNLGPDYEQAFRAVFDALGRRPGVLYEPVLPRGRGARCRR